MELFILATFILGYTAITLEHSIKIDKLVPALLMMVICWTTIALNIDGIQNWIDPHSGTLISVATANHEVKSELLKL